jgi:rod shape-determining protein MreD
MMLRRVRLTLVVVTLVVLQNSVFSHLAIFDARPVLCLIAAVALAYEEGPQSGAAFGFVSGLATDMILTTPIGLSALAFAVTGYLVGFFQGGLVRESPLIAPVLGAGAGAVGGVIFLVVGGIAGEPGFFTIHSVRVLLVSGLYDALIAIPVFAFVHWANHDSDRTRGWR